MAKDTESPVRRRLWEFVQGSAGVLMLQLDRQGEVRRMNEAARTMLGRYGVKEAQPLPAGVPGLGGADVKTLAGRFSAARDGSDCGVELESEDGERVRYVFRGWKLRSGMVLFGEPSRGAVPDPGGRIGRLRADLAESSRLLAARTQETRRFSSELEEMGRQIERHARTDPLTGLPNRRQFLDALRREWERHKRYKRPYAVLLVGVDRLRNLSEAHGLAAVGAALVMVFELLKGRLRTADYMARFADDQFAVLLYETEGPSAAKAARLLRDRVAQRKIVLPSDAELAVTVGGSEIAAADRHAEEVLQRAAAVLRKGRIEGEDRAVFLRRDGDEC